MINSYVYSFCVAETPFVQHAGHAAFAAKPSRRLAISCAALPATAAAFDVAIFTLAAVAGEFAYSHSALGAPSTPNALGGGLLTGALFASFAQLAGLYRLPAILAPGDNLARLTLAVAVGELAQICVLFLLKSGADHSRGAAIGAAALALALIPLARLTLGRLCRYAIHHGAIRGRRVVTLGDFSNSNGSMTAFFRCSTWKRWRASASPAPLRSAA